MPDFAAARGTGGASGIAMQHFLSAVHEALRLPAPRRAADRLPYLKLLEQRCLVARASLGRLIADPYRGELDYTSEGDHILHQIADLPPDTYQHSAPS